MGIRRHTIYYLDGILSCSSPQCMAMGYGRSTMQNEKSSVVFTWSRATRHLPLFPDSKVMPIYVDEEKWKLFHSISVVKYDIFIWMVFFFK